MAGGSTSKIELLVWLSQVVGGLCSKSTEDEHVVKDCQVGNKDTEFTTVPQRMDRNTGTSGCGGGDGVEDFYDGIPRFTDSFRHKSVTSRQVAVAKVGFTFCSQSIHSPFTNLY